MSDRQDPWNAFIEVFTEPLTTRSEGLLSNTKFAVKDVFLVSGHATSFGLRPPLIAESNCTACLVEQLLSAGAELVGRANLDAACLGGSGLSSNYGRVVNVVDPVTIPGGSSSGSSSAVASGMVDFALGTDSGGSIRVPSACSQTIGFKFSRTRQEQLEDGVVLLDTDLDSLGVITNTFEILESILEHIFASERETFKPLPSDFKVWIPNLDQLSLASSEVQEAFMEKVFRLGKLTPWEYLPKEIDFVSSGALRKGLMAIAFRDLVDKCNLESDVLPDEASALLHLAKEASPAEIKAEAESLRTQLIKVVGNESLVLTPSLPYRAPMISENTFSHPLNLYLTTANLCNLPAICFPVGPGSDAIGVGHIQVFGFCSELQLFHAARSLSTQFY